MKTQIKLEDLGYNQELEQFRLEHNIGHFDLGRIIAEHKESYIVKTERGDLEAEITGNMRFTAKEREDFPAVGDWVALTTQDADFAIIHQILPRHSIIKRQAVGKYGEIQIIATNIDYALIVQAVDRDFNINRLERYLTICNSSGVKPIIVLSKVDLIDESHLQELLETMALRIKQIPVVSVSNAPQIGYQALIPYIEKGLTYCLLGSSGVGKSTLLNNISGSEIMKTDLLSSSTHKGKHVTSHRELIILQNGAILIDNPGMREVGVADAGSGVEITFDKIMRLSHNCKFKDCTHTSETGCAVLQAVEKGEIEKGFYENYLKMERETAYFESTVAEKRQKDKDFGKMLKNYKKDIKRNKA